LQFSSFDFLKSSSSSSSFLPIGENEEDADCGIEILPALRHCSCMSYSEQHDEPTVCNISETRKPVEPCTIVIFGASGDLTARKLIPALYHLAKDKQMPPAYPHHRLRAARQDG
jgi:hypothetical protein